MEGGDTWEPTPLLQLPTPLSFHPVHPCHPLPSTAAVPKYDDNNEYKFVLIAATPTFLLVVVGAVMATACLRQASPFFGKSRAAADAKEQASVAAVLSQSMHSKTLQAQPHSIPGPIAEGQEQGRDHSNGTITNNGHNHAHGPAQAQASAAASAAVSPDMVELGSPGNGSSPARGPGGGAAVHPAPSTSPARSLSPGSAGGAREAASLDPHSPGSPKGAPLRVAGPAATAPGGDEDEGWGLCWYDLSVYAVQGSLVKAAMLHRLEERKRARNSAGPAPFELQHSYNLGWQASNSWLRGASAQGGAQHAQHADPEAGVGSPTNGSGPAASHSPTAAAAAGAASGAHTTSGTTASQVPHAPSMLRTHSARIAGLDRRKLEGMAGAPPHCTPILIGVSGCCRSGEVMGLLGPSGSGK